MDHRVVCSLRFNTQVVMRRLILVLPLLFAGCFDSQSKVDQKNPEEGLGIAAVSRFFSFAPAVPEESERPGIQSESQAPIPADSTSGQTASIGGISELRAETPLFFETYAISPEFSHDVLPSRTSDFTRAALEPEPSFDPAAALILDGSFEKLYASLFRSTESDDIASSQSVEKDEFSNPFTQARQEQEAKDPPPAEPEAPQAEPEPEVVDQTKEKTENTPETAQPESTEGVSPPSATGIPPEDHFLVIGDFDGSGTVSAVAARRSGDTSFISEDGEYGFDLSINPAAVEQERAFSVDDLNADGHPDLLYAMGSSLVGGVLLADGSGGYDLEGTFVTGYEPVVPCAGPFRDGMREILMVNMRSGALSTLHKSESSRWSHYQKSKSKKLDFVPDYLLHLVEQNTFLDYLMVAQMSGAAQIFRWMDNRNLESAAHRLDADPLVWSSDFKAGSVEIYQVGDYASVVLTSQGHSFNVANMRVFPQIFLVIGDLKRHGFTDVGIGDLQFFIPAEPAD